MENMNNNQNFDNTVSGVERVSKKKGKKIALVSGIAVVAIAGGGVAAYNLSDYVKNQVNLRVMKPENYYSWVIEENSKEFASKAKDSYSKVYDKATNSYGSSFNLKYNISDDAKDIALKHGRSAAFSDFYNWFKAQGFTVSGEEAWVFLQYLRKNGFKNVCCTYYCKKD